MPSVCREVIQSTVLLCQHSSRCLFAWLHLRSRDGVFSLVTHAVTSHVSVSMSSTAAGDLLTFPTIIFTVRKYLLFKAMMAHTNCQAALRPRLLFGILLQWECDQCGRDEFLHSRRLYNRLIIRWLTTLQGHLNKAYVSINN